jgi:hypothetical protein
MWLMLFPVAPGDERLLSPFDSGLYTYRWLPAAPDFTYTASTPMFDVQSNVFGVRFVIVTDSVPSECRPDAGGSTFSSVQSAPVGSKKLHVLLEAPGTCVGATPDACAAGDPAEAASSTPANAAAPASAAASPAAAIPRSRPVDCLAPAVRVSLIVLPLRCPVVKKRSPYLTTRQLSGRFRPLPGGEPGTSKRKPGRPPSGAAFLQIRRAVVGC